MKTLIVYGKNYSLKPIRSRTMSRGIIICDGKILLSHEKNTGKWLTPGGRVERGEKLTDACIREMAEETGLKVELMSEEPYLTVNEFYAEHFFSTNYFVCKITGECEKKLTDYELKVGNECVWVEMHEAIRIFADYTKYKETDEFKHGHHFREYNALCMLV